MDWRDIACIVFACTAVNHLGLIDAIQTVTKCNRLPIISCPKCLTCWSVMAYGCLCCDTIATAIEEVPRLFAISLLCSYIAIWLELFMYAIDTLYHIIYGIIENNQENRDEG